MRFVHPTMLWESTDADAALTQRFQFASVEETTRWLTATLAGTYGVSVESVDRLVISSANLLAWLTTADGPLIVKCCAFVSAHERLSNVADLLVWLDQKQLPVSVPLRSRTGQRQVRCDHLSLGVQPMLPGNLLDPTQLVQAQTAGVTLAQLHTALAIYPRAADFTIQPALPTLQTSISDWIAKNATRGGDSVLHAGSALLREALQRGALPDLPSQIVHHDYRSANILWHEDQIGAVLDFEDVQSGYSINDLAWAAVYLGTRFRDWGPVLAKVHAAFVAGYESLHPLNEAEQTWLSILMIWHSTKLAYSANT